MREHFKRIFGLHTTDALRDLHDEIRKALEEDDALPTSQKKYRVRQFPDFRIEAEVIEAELTHRGEEIEAIEWLTPSES